MSYFFIIRFLNHILVVITIHYLIYYPANRNRGVAALNIFEDLDLSTLQTGNDELR